MSGMEKYGVNKTHELEKRASKEAADRIKQAEAIPAKQGATSLDKIKREKNDSRCSTCAQKWVNCTCSKQ